MNNRGVSLAGGVRITAAILLLAFLSATAGLGQQLVLDDPLQGSTSGTRGGGSFVSGGWKVGGIFDFIYWHLPYPVSRGAVEFNVTGLNPNENREEINDKSELFHMYDHTFDNADTNYGGYRNNPYKHFIRKIGAIGGATNALELLLQISPNYVEPDSDVLGWSSTSTYLFREEWEPDGFGNCQMRTYRNGILLKTMTVPGNWTPTGHAVRIAASSGAGGGMGRGAPTDAVYSNVKVWDMAAAAPSTPTVTRPLNGSTVNSLTPLIQWGGSGYTWYQVRVNTANNAGSGIVWDSGQVNSSAYSTTTGTLADLTDYYVFVRLANTIGWSSWSPAGHMFRVDTSYVPPAGGMVRLNGYSAEDDAGPFLGLGASYFQAMRRCKYDRARFRSDLSFMSQQGVKYVRTLSMVGWYEAWAGKEIAPVSFNNRVGTYVPAWPDYWQQFRDAIDIAYDDYGIRTEMTIFADAQLIPNKSDRINHMQNVLNNLAGREHKIMHLEVCNEYWQNGFPDAQGIADLREFGQYLKDRTTLIVALSDSLDHHCAGVQEMYSGSAADLVTEHFSRDIWTSEGGWLPVRSTWDLVTCANIPPISSNEPIGPGSSVNTENDPIKLVSAAAFAWIAKLPMYVFHSEAGVFGNTRFEDQPGIRNYIHLFSILPPDMPNWARNDGKEFAAPFTAYCMGQPDKYWTDVGGATNGCHRNIGGRKGNEFVCYPQGILPGGLILEARQQMTFRAYDALTGALILDTTLSAGGTCALPQGSGAYIIRGTLEIDIPDPVTDFSAIGGDMLNVLSWTNPTSGSFSGTMIRYKTSGYPTGPTDGILLVDKLAAPGSSETYVHSGLSSGVTYYYSAFSHDRAQNCAEGVEASATPTGYHCFMEPFAYPNGKLNDNDGWYGDDTDQIVLEGESVKILGGAGAFNATRDIACSPGPTGEIWMHTMVKPGVGDAYMWGLWLDDPAGNNLARWYGHGTLVRGRIGGHSIVTGEHVLPAGWNYLKVKVTPASKTAQFFLNGVSIGVLDYTVSGAGSTVGRVRFERMSNSDAPSHYVFFDNLSIGGQDITPLGPVSDFTATGASNSVDLAWINSVQSGSTGTMIRYKMTGYPANPTDGTLVVEKANVAGSSDSHVHTGLTNGANYYYSAFAQYGGSNYAAPVFAQATPSDLRAINSSTFGAGAEGWNIVVWRNDPNYDYGTMAWNGSVGNPGGAMRATGAGETDSDGRCLREGGEIWKVISTTGYHGIHISYDFRVGSLGTSNTGTGSGGCAVDHDLVDEQLTVFYSTNGGANWSEAEWLKRSELLAYQSYGTRIVDLSGVAGVNNNPNFALRFRWQFNSKPEHGDYGDLDNILVMGINSGPLHGLKGLPNGTPVAVADKALYLKRSGFGYIEEQDRSSGMRIQGSISPSEGSLVSLSGTMQTTAGGERYIQIDSITSTGSSVVLPLGVNNRGLAEVLLEGLFVRAWGVVKAGSITGNSYVITDGSDEAGIKVMTDGAPTVSEGQYVTISGAAGYDGGRVIYVK